MYRALIIILSLYLSIVAGGGVLSTPDTNANTNANANTNTNANTNANMNANYKDAGTQNGSNQNINTNAKANTKSNNYKNAETQLEWGENIPSYRGVIQFCGSQGPKYEYIGKEPWQLRITALCKDQNGKQQRLELYPSTCLEWNRESKTLEGSDVDWGHGLIDGGCTDCKFQGWTLTCYCDGKNAPPKLLKDRNKVTINMGEHISSAVLNGQLTRGLQRPG